MSTYMFPVGQDNQTLRIYIEDEHGAFIDMNNASDITVFWVTPGGLEFRPDFTIVAGLLEISLDDISPDMGTYYVQAQFTYQGVQTLSVEQEVEGYGQPWVPLREPVVHYRVGQSPYGGTQWAGMSVDDLLAANVRVFDILYEIDTGRWKVFNGRGGFDDLQYVNQTDGTIDALLNIFGQVNIINMALGRLGQGPIVDLTDNKPGARLGQQYYRITVSEVMSQYDWTSAIERKVLEPVPEDAEAYNPHSGYSMQYYLPMAPKPIRVLHLFMYHVGAYQRTDTPFKIEGDYLYTNIENAGLVYIGDYSAQAGRLDPYVVELIVLGLAARMAYSITSSQRFSDQLWNEYTSKLASAQFADASRSRERTNIDVFPQPTDSWVGVDY